MGASAGHHHNYTAIAGGTLTGAATGAVAGSALGPPGAIIGGAVGAIGGFLGGLSQDTPDDLPPPEAPPPPPDVADEISKRAAMVKQQRLMASGTGSFLTGPLGDTSSSGGAAPKLGGL